MNGKEDQVQQEGVMKGNLSPELQSVIENIAKKEGYITYEINTTKIDSGGDNYTAALLEADIKGKTKHGEKETNLFLKKVFNDGFVTEIATELNVCEKENYFYRDLVKRYHELQSEANVPEEERYKVLKHYECSDPTTLIFENMAKKGFGTPHRMDVVSVKYAELCIVQLAKFHALSFVLKIKDPYYFEDKVAHFKHALDDNEKTRSLCENAIKMTTKDLDPINTTKAERVMVKFFRKFFYYMNPESSSVTCLCHGDFRGGNILMRKDEGEAVEVVPIDFQAFYIGNPVLDFLYFIACGTDRKFRVQNFENLKTLYYDTMTNFLKYFNIDSNDVFPRREMDEIFRQKMDFVPMFAVMMFAFAFAPEKALDVSNLKDGNVKLDERYEKRLIEILEDFPI